MPWGKTSVNAGDHVICTGLSPSTGRRMQGEHGDVTATGDHFGNKTVTVELKGGDTETLYEDNVSGTGQCGGRRGCRA